MGNKINIMDNNNNKNNDNNKNNNKTTSKQLGCDLIVISLVSKLILLFLEYTTDFIKEWFWYDWLYNMVTWIKNTFL